MKVCIIVPAHWEAIMGGSQYQAKLVIEHLLARFDIQVFYLTTLVDPAHRPRGYSIVQFSDRRGLRRYGTFLDAVRLYRALRRIEPEVILQFTGCAHTGIAAFYAKRNHCKMIWRVTNDPNVDPPRLPWWRIHDRIERGFLNYGIRNAWWILAQTRYQQDRLKTAFGRSNVSTLPNSHPQPPDRLPQRQRKALIVWVANLKPHKNPDAFVRLARALAHRDDVRFAMAGRVMGGDGWARELLASIEETENLEYLGELRQDEVNELLDGADLFVNTSDYEGFPNTFIQAWMRRVPVLSLHVDPDGLLTRRRLGMCCGTEAQLQARILRLLEAPDRVRLIGARCRAYATASHSIANLDHLVQVLQAADVPFQAPLRAQATQ